jgi:C4-dicarboxylate-specific signal transduction histidine kinase
MDTCTRSDHKAISAEFRINYLLANFSIAKSRSREYKRTIFLYDEAKEEDWEQYRKTLEMKLNKSSQIRKILEEENNVDNIVEGKIDQAWEDIANAILEAAKKHIPKK